MNPTAIGARSTSRTSVRVTALALFVALLGTLIVSPADAADPGAEASFVDLLNSERSAAGLPTLAVAADLTDVARRHSARMADQNDLHHNPNLASDVSGWQSVGENVGRGPRVQPIHDAFMDSSGHRANILDADWTEVGVGVEIRDGVVWVTEVFREPATQEHAADDAPTTAPASEEATSPTDEPAADAPAPAAAPPSPSPASTAAATGAAPAAGPTTGPGRSTFVLARLEAAEQGRAVSSLLED